MFTKSKTKDKKGFTLIELLVVISIIGLLSTLAVVALGNARKSARDARRANDMGAISKAFELHADANNGSYSACTGTVPGRFSVSCASGTILSVLPGATTLVDPSGSTTRCGSGAADYNAFTCPASGGCDYALAAQSSSDFEVWFCLEAQTGTLSAGKHRVTRAGIQ